MFPDEYDDEEEVEEVVQVFEVPEEEMYDEDDDEAADALAASYSAKGRADRDLVDAQAREYDDKKKLKRDEVTRLKQFVLSSKSVLSKRERALHDLDIALKKDHYLETRERVVREREEATASDAVLHEEAMNDELKEIEKRNARAAREEESHKLAGEVSALKQEINDAVRRIATLEQELLRS
jgi:hypothetical protein